MQVEQVIERLEELSDPRAVAAWARMEVSPELYIGVNLTKLKIVAKEIKKNHDLALELWRTGIHDAKLLATMIEDPRKVTLDQIDRQIEQIYSPDLIDKYCANVVAKTPFLLRKIEQWTQHRGEMIKRAGYVLVMALARDENLTEDAFFHTYLQRIEAEVGGERNWVREAMNYALIAIGSRSVPLNRQAAAIAERIGRIEIDYGDTSCQAPDARAKIQAKFAA